MKKYKLLLLFFLISLLYALVALLGPTDTATLTRYHLTQQRTHMLNLTVVLPLLTIWQAAFYGFSVFRSYAHFVTDTKEGPAFKQLAMGLGLLAFSLPVNSASSSLLNLLVIYHPSFSGPGTIAKNYIILLLPMLAFLTLNKGAEKLVMLSKRGKKPLLKPELWSLGAIIVSCLYTWLIISRPDASIHAANVYNLPNWLIISTLVVPYLYTWFRGVQAAYFITVYQHNVRGSLYRRSLAFLSSGVLVVIVLNVLIQLITTLSSRLYRLHLTPLLIIVYVLIALYAVGFGLIASGAKKLKRIEEV